MLQNSTFLFLNDLAENNNREWFAANKPAYLAAKADTEAFTVSLIREASRFDPLLAELQPKDCLFRIYRDTRFSKDKTPYKTHMGLWLCPTGRNSNGPGYYLHIAPGASFLAGGYWMPAPAHLKAIRQEIDYNSQELKQLLEAASFRKFFSGLDEEHALKTAPQGYPKDHPDIDLLKLKSFTVRAPLKDSALTGARAARSVARGWEALYPLNSYLRTAVDGFK